MARRIYLRGSIGIGSFKKIYGGNKYNGSRPGHFCDASGSVARAVVKTLMKLGVVSQDAKNPTGYVLRVVVVLCGPVEWEEGSDSIRAGCYFRGRGR